MKVLFRKLASRLLQLSPLTLTAIALLYTLAVGVVDMAFPLTMTVALLYMLGVAFVAWASANRPATVAVSLASVALMSLHQLSKSPVPLQPWIEVWNVSTRLVVFIATGLLVVQITQLTRHLGRLVEDRTRECKAEVERHQETSTRLAEALERFEQVINNITQVFWLTDVHKSQLVYVSPGYEHLWGRPCKQLYGDLLSWTQSVHPDDRAEVTRRSRTEQARNNYDVEYRILRPDGSLRWIRDRAFPVRNAQGEVYRIAGIAEDITERKQTRKVLQTQAAILENMAEAVVVTDEKGVIVQMNPAAERIWGYERNELLGQPASHLSALPQPEATKLMREVLAALQATGSWRGIFQNRRKDGAFITCEAMISSLKIQNRVLLVAVQQDITERLRSEEALRQSEEALRAFLHAIPEPALLLDRHGLVLLGNQTVARNLGVTNEELLGKDVFSYLAPETAAKRRSMFDQVIARGQALQFDDVRDNRVFLSWLSPLKDATGQVSRVAVLAFDVTARKQAEAALRGAHDLLEKGVQQRTAQLQAANRALSESEARLRLALDASRAGTWSWDSAGNQSAWDDRYHELYGFAPDAPRTFDAWLARVHPADQPVLRARIQTLLKPEAGDIWNEEFRALHPLKGERWMGGLGRVERDPTGRAVRFSGINLDITERKHMEQALRDSEAKYRRLHESMTDAYVAVDLEGRIIDTNRAYQALLGYTPAELSQLTYMDLTPEKWHAFETRIVTEQVLLSGHSGVYEKEYRRKDGTVLPVELRTFLLRDAGGQPNGMWAIVRDITERKRSAEALREARDQLELRVQERTAELQAANRALIESEERYRSLVDNLNVGIYRSTTDPVGRFIQANPALARMHGYDSVAEFRQTPVADLYQDPHDRQRLLTELQRHGTLTNYELRLRRKNGASICCSMNASAHRNSQGELDWIDGLLEDITERKQAEFLLQAQRDVGVGLSSARNMADALQRFLDVAVRIGGLDCGGIYLVNVDTQELTLAAHRNLSHAFVQEVSHYAADSPQAKLVRQGQCIFTQIENLPVPPPSALRHEGLQAIAVIPLSHNGRIIGALNLASHQVQSTSAQTQIVVEAIANQAAGAIARIGAEAEHHRLEHQILEISDREHARIGQDIHDGLCQHLVSLAFDANSLDQELALGGRPEARKARRISDYLDQAITEARQLSRGLFPVRLQTEGLRPALEELCKATRDRFQIQCRFTSEGTVRVEDSALATHLYRIAQEAITNAVKHSQARRVTIRWHARANQLKLQVQDNGSGISSSARRRSKGLGLHIMDYRARSIGGTLHIGAGPHGGTVVSCCIPIASR